MHSSAQDPGAQAQSKQKRTGDQQVCLVRAENKPKSAKTKEAKDFSKSEAELVDVTDTLQHGMSNIEKEVAKNSTFLQKGIDTRSMNNATVALITMKTSMSRAFSEQ